MINFIEDRCTNYQHRTFINADQSDATLAFAVDYSTAGEKCTMNACRNCERPIYMFEINKEGKLSTDRNKPILDNCINYLKGCQNITLNVAGNGIYTFAKYGITQSRLNDIITGIISYLINEGCDIKVVRSGGQTGADEAGIVAGCRLGLETICLCPKGWRFRDINNQDIKSEELFKKRFSL